MQKYRFGKRKKKNHFRFSFSFCFLANGMAAFLFYFLAFLFFDSEEISKIHCKMIYA
jgi:hypothetical protein